MISYPVYKLIHIVGLAILFLALGSGLAIRAVSEENKRSWKKVVGVFHGFGLFVVLLGGFGMLARLGVHWPWPGWIIAKLLIWFAFGALLVAIKREWLPNKIQTLLFLFLVGLAAYFALWKPFSGAE